MNRSSHTNSDREEPICCPKCGAPAPLPEGLDGVVVSCRFCNDTFAIPRSIREAQERRLSQRLPRSETASPTSAVVAVVIVLTLLGALFAGVVAYRTVQGPPAPQPPAPPSLPEPVPSIPPTNPIDESVASGEDRVQQLIKKYTTEGCESVLLAPTRIVGGRDIDAKLVGNGPCVRLLASSGTTNDSLELTMQTPKRKSIATPPAGPVLDFLYCAKQAGLHPATIRSLGDNPFTVASIECPRSSSIHTTR